jgi:DNA-directed RNA polymerase subunit RPC12/RpoP
MCMELPSGPTIIGSQHAPLFQTLAQQAQEILTTPMCKEQRIRHVCPVCKKSVLDLTQHTKRAHNIFVTYDERPYKCDTCDSSFNGTKDLLRHSKIPHVYRCNHCTYSFISLGKLQRHLNYKHL